MTVKGSGTDKINICDKDRTEIESYECLLRGFTERSGLEDFDMRTDGNYFGSDLPTSSVFESSTVRSKGKKGGIWADLGSR